jgi:glutamine---fructose-6-phosphate transaminase (isomerizing)
MCGIVGYIGGRNATPVLLDGLRRLEYRGYDSAGIAVLDQSGIKIVKQRGKIEDGLARKLAQTQVPGTCGIGHTRWATHGPPSNENAHPHTDQSGHIAIVHNGVIENYDRLKARLVNAGHIFKSDTDTEVLAHLIGMHFEQLTELDPAKRLTQAVIAAVQELQGTYGLAVVSTLAPHALVGARRGSPLIIGVGQGENFMASDASAMVAYTRQVVYLNDFDVATVTRDHFEITNLKSGAVTAQTSQVEFDVEAVEKGGFPHFMLKEIFEQPKTIANALRGRLDSDDATAKFGGLNLSPSELRQIERIVIVACGTSWHAGLVGEYLIEGLAHIPVEVEYASEFRYRNPPIDKNSLILAITQSGETLDTLAGLREAKRRGHKVLALCNVIGSTIAREADGGIYLHAGPEIGVASTKAFTSQVTVLLLLSLLLGRMRMLSIPAGLEIIRALEALPAQIESLLARNSIVQQIARKYAQQRDFFFLGRQIHFPVALEGALKLKEISYLHAEGYPAAEMKHGPIALIDDATPTVVLAPLGHWYDKTMGNLQEIKARKGPIIALTTEGNESLAKTVDDIIYLPAAPECVTPMLAIIPLQLLAYHIAVLRGCDVDKPRNLAKSVTVE